MHKHPALFYFQRPIYLFDNGFSLKKKKMQEIFQKENLTSNRQVVERQVKKELKKLGSIRPRRGHRLFKLQDGIVTAVTDADFSDSFVTLNGKKKRKLIIEKGADYISALNKKNAIKHFKKGGVLK